MSGLPEFPLLALPPSLGGYAMSVADATQTPIDLVAMTMLGVLSTVCLGATVTAANHREELCLYTMVVMEPGEGKSSVVSAVTAPLREIIAERQAEQAPALRELRSRREVWEHRRRYLLQKYGKTDDDEARAEIWQQIVDADAQIAKFGALDGYRLLADDVTPEALSHLLVRHGRIGIISAEGSAVDNIVGAQYTDGKAAKLDVVLRAYRGEPLTVDRRGRDAEHADRPLLSILLAIQPSYLEGLIGHQRSRSLGLVSRFAFVMPPQIVGHRDADPPAVDQGFSDAWSSTLRTLHTYILSKMPTQLPQLGQNASSVGSVRISLNKGDEVPLPLSLELSPDARQMLLAARREIEPQLAPGGELSHIKDWASRHVSRITRIAAILHLASTDRTARQISGDAFRRARDIGDYLLAHARAALEEDDTAVLRATLVLARWPSESISERDLQHEVFYGRGSAAADARTLAARLVERGSIERLPPPPKRPGRPPSPRYKINKDTL